MKSYEHLLIRLRSMPIPCRTASMGIHTPLHSNTVTSNKAADSSQPSRLDVDFRSQILQPSIQGRCNGFCRLARVILYRLRARPVADILRQFVLQGLLNIAHESLEEVLLPLLVLQCTIPPSGQRLQRSFNSAGRDIGRFPDRLLSVIGVYAGPLRVGRVHVRDEPLLDSKQQFDAEARTGS